jgi:hypothetical protein
MLTQEELNLLGAPLRAHECAFGADYYYFENHIYIVDLPKYELVTHEIVRFGYDFLERNNAMEHHSIFIFNSFTDISKEVREWAADRKQQRFTLSDAIVIKESAQQIITDFYLKVDKPSWPTSVFFSFREAVAWTLEQD